jgi:hypothetical protein
MTTVPLIGGTVAELFEFVIAPSLERRRDEWLRRLGAAVDELRERFDGFDPKNPEGNEAFVTAVLAATPIAMKTNDEDKLEMLKNAVMNAAIGAMGIAEHEQLTFLRLIDELTPLHLRFLTFMTDPQGWFERTGITPPSFGMAGSPAAVLEAGLPELRGHRDVFEQLDRDLDVRGLVQGGSLFVTMTPQGAFGVRAKDLGRRFVEFVTKP